MASFSASSVGEGEGDVLASVGKQATADVGTQATESVTAGSSSSDSQLGQGDTDVPSSGVASSDSKESDDSSGDATPSPVVPETPQPSEGEEGTKDPSLPEDSANAENSAPSDVTVSPEPSPSGDAAEKDDSSKADDKGDSAKEEPGQESPVVQDPVKGAEELASAERKQTVEDGTYVIETAVNDKQVVDVENGSKSDSSNVQIYQSNMSAAQKWDIVYNAQLGYYAIRLHDTKLYLALAGATNGSNVEIAAGDGTLDSMLWQIIESSGGYRIVSKLGYALDVAGGSGANGTNLQGWESYGGLPQLFYLLNTVVNVRPGDTLDSGDGAYVVVMGGNENNAVNVAGGSHANGANIEVYKKNGTNSQSLYFKSDGKGYYSIIVERTGKALDVTGSNLVSSTNVQQWDAHGGDSQKWALHKNSDGTFYFVNKATGLVLDVSNGNVQVYRPNSSRAQSFRLFSTGSVVKGTIVDLRGTYIFESGVADRQVMDVLNGWRANGANVQTYQSNMSAAQKWTIEDAGNGYVTIGMAGTDLVLDIAGGSMADGANVQLYKKNHSAAQRWKILKLDNRYVIVSMLRNDLVLDIAGGGISNGTNIQAYTFNGLNNQRFYLLSTNPKVLPGDAIAEGAYVITASGNNGFAANVAAGSSANGANIELYGKNDSGAQRVFLSRDNLGYYTITVLGSGKAFDVAGSDLVPGANVQQWDSYGGDSQKWALRKNADGTWSFTNKATGLLLDIAGGALRPGTNLQAYRDNGSISQRFTLIGTTVLTNGIYEIDSFAKPDMAIDVAGGSTANGAKVQVWSSNGSRNQRFEVVYDQASDTYRIRTASSGGWLTVRDGLVVQMGSSKTAASADNMWKAVWNGGYFSLMNVATSLVLNLQYGSTSNGTALETVAANRTHAQHFLFKAAKLVVDGLYEFHSALGMNLDVAGGSRDQGGNIQVWNDNNLGSQKFYLISSEDGFIIKNLLSGLVLDVINGSTANGANVRQWAANGSDAQLWRAEIGDGGTIVFVNVKSGKALNVAQGSSAAGANIEQLDVNRTPAQCWKIEETQGFGWVSIDGTWYFYHTDGTRQAFSNAAYSAYQAIRNWSSKTQYLICIDNTNFRTIVFQGSAGNWEPIKDWTCSVGRTHPTDPTFGITARGVFEIFKKGYIMGSDPDYYYWSEFFNNGADPNGEGQRFHSVGYYRGTNTIYDKGIGGAQTHGCVRLYKENAKWIYDNAPMGTKVYSYTV